MIYIHKIKIPSPIIDNHETGFSLVELMVVIAIIAVISSIASGAYSNYLKGAHEQALDTRARQVRQVVSTCFVENSDTINGNATNLTNCFRNTVSDAGTDPRVVAFLGSPGVNTIGVSVKRNNSNAGEGVYTVTVTKPTNAPTGITHPPNHVGTVTKNILTWTPR